MATRKRGSPREISHRMRRGCGVFRTIGVRHGRTRTTLCPRNSFSLDIRFHNGWLVFNKSRCARFVCSRFTRANGIRKTRCPGVRAASRIHQAQAAAAHAQLF